jgi:hypothetical protein
MTLIFCCTTVFSGIDTDFDEVLAAIKERIVKAKPKPIDNPLDKDDPLDKHFEWVKERVILTHEKRGIEEAKDSIVSDMRKHSRTIDSVDLFFFAVHRCKDLDSLKMFLDNIKETCTNSI